MFTGTNNPAKSNNVQQPDDWSLNPAFYQNIANDSVDWAAIAAKWIQMKESYPQDIMIAPPPPNITSSNVSPPSRSGLDEKGEAPMEVEKDDDILSNEGNSESYSSSSNSAQSQVWATTWSTVQQTQQWRNPAWEHNWRTETPTVVQQSRSSQAVPGTVSIAANTKSETKNNTNYWPNKMYKTVPSTEIAKIPGLMDEVIKMDNSDDESSNAAALESAKRKLLPAWIREGLEKMEREKQKTIERENEMKERVKMLEERRRLEEEAMVELQKSNQAFVPKSKFDSDSENDNESDSAIPDNAELREPSPPPEDVKPQRPREELIQELMLSVRKNLTEILLEVTNEEIANLAKETLSKTRRKAPTAQSLRKTALSSLTGGLGLGIYADSSDDSGSDEETGSKRDDDEDGTDTETELVLQENVRRKKREFEVTAKQIEAEIEEEEAEEERKNHENDRVKEPAVQDKIAGSSNKSALMQREGETQPNDKLYSLQKQSGRGKSRFSDVNDTVRNTHITHVAIIPEHPGQPISIVPIGGTNTNASNPPPNSDSSDSRSNSSRHKKKKSKKHKKHKRKSDEEEDDRSSSRRRSKSQDSRKTVRSSHRRSRSTSRSTHRRSRSGSSRSHHRDRDRDERSRRDRKYSSSSRSTTKRSRSKSRDRQKRRSRSRSKHRHRR